MTSRTLARPAAAATAKRSGVLALLPLACAIHCLLTPVLVALVPALDVAPAVEWVLLAASVTIAMRLLRNGGRIYRNGRIWVLTGVSAAVWALSLIGVFEPLPETVTSAVGGVGLAVGLFWNGRLSHQHACRDCGCPMH